jgi:ABC-type multidrug transport system fused ATPase/permease subunit
MVGTGLQIAIPVVVQLIIDIDILGGDSVDVASAARRGAIAAVAMGLAAVARRAATFRLARLSASALAELRIKVFAHLHRLSASTCSRSAGVRSWLGSPRTSTASRTSWSGAAWG